MPKSSNQKGSVVVLLVVIMMAIVGVGAYSLGVYLKAKNQVQTKITEITSTPTPLPTPSSKKYQDSDLGFYFDLPAGYEVIADNEANYNKRAGGDMQKNFKETWWYNPPTLVKGIIVKPTNFKITSQFDPVPMILWVFDNPNNLDPQAWYRKYWYYPFVWGEYEPGKSKDNPNLESTISGQLAEEKEISQQPGTPEMVYISYNQKMYLFRIVNKSATDKIGDQVLASFVLPSAN